MSFLTLLPQFWHFFYLHWSYVHFFQAVLWIQLGKKKWCLQQKSLVSNLNKDQQSLQLDKPQRL